MWFALNEDRPLFAFAGIWTEFKGERGPKSKPIPGPASRLWLPDRLRRAQANHASPRRPLHHRTAQDRTRCRMAGRNGGAGADYQRWRPMVMARIGMMQDAALQIADAVQTTKIGRRPKSPVMETILSPLGPLGDPFGGPFHGRWAINRRNHSSTPSWSHAAGIAARDDAGRAEPGARRDRGRLWSLIPRGR